MCSRLYNGSISESGHIMQPICKADSCHKKRCRCTSLCTMNPTFILFKKRLNGAMQRSIVSAQTGTPVQQLLSESSLK